MTKREKAYNKMLQELIDKVGRLDDRAVKKVVTMLEQAQKEIAAQVAMTDWQAYQIPQLKEAVQNAIDGFKQQYLAGQNEALTDSWHAGIDLVDHPLATAGISLRAPQLSRSVLEIMQGYSADLIKGLSADAIKKINNEITMGIMGQKSSFEVMKTIGRNFEDKSILTGISNRAETITRTEMARVQSAARAGRINSVAAYGTDPELKWKKKWISSGKAHPRAWHAALDNVIVDVDEDFPGGIPYPHAPGLPAEEVINCG